MKTFLLAIFALALISSLNAQETTSQPTTPAATKTDHHEFNASELRNIRLDMSDGTLSFKAQNATFTYQPALDSVEHTATQSEKIAAGALFLSELRHASKVIVSASPSSSDHVLTQLITLEFKSSKQ